MKKTIFLDQEIEVLVVSAGGVGTTFLMEAIAKFRTTNSPSNKDGYKHLPIPPLTFGPPPKVIYVYGNPVMAAISLFRRNYHHAQSVQQNKYLLNKKILPLHLSLSEYIHQGKDDLKLQLHFENWYARYRFCDVLFIRYDDMHGSVKCIRKFLDLPQDFITQFPKKVERKSSTANLSPQQFERLQKIYQPFLLRLEQLEACFVRPKSNNFSSLTALRSISYWIGFKRAISKRMQVAK